MNKQVFVIEVETVGERKPLRDFQLFAAIKTGFDELFDGDFRVESVAENTVEQNVERSKNQDKTLDLLRRACERLNWLVQCDRPSHVDPLACEIDEFLIGETVGD